MNVRSARALVLATALIAPALPAAAAPPGAFVESIGVAADYHRELSRLHDPNGRYRVDPEVAFDRYAELTIAALDGQQTIDVQACFVDWWAFEYMGLQLTAASHAMRRVDPTAVQEADIVEQLGRRMFYEARALLPIAAERCQDAV